jgi:hypothetical protein
MYKAVRRSPVEVAMHQLAVKAAERPEPKPKPPATTAASTATSAATRGYEPPYRLRLIRPRFPIRKGFGAGRS